LVNSDSSIGGGGGISASLHRLMKNLVPALFLVLIQRPGLGVTVVLGWSASGSKEANGAEELSPREGNKELN